MKKNSTNHKKEGPLLVGLTGGIGVGKSFCASIFAWFDIPLYDSDREAKLIMVTDTDVIHQIKELCGDESYNAEGELDRAHVASKIFEDHQMLAKMNAIVHPAVRDHFRKWALAHNTHPYVIQESALIFETGSYKSFDKVIVVDAPLELRLERTMARDNSTREQVMSRISKQHDQAEKVKLADFVITNDGQSMITTQIIQIHQALLAFDKDEIRS